MTETLGNDNDLPSEQGLVAWAWESMKSREWPEAAKRWQLIRKLYPENEPAWVQGGIAEKNLHNVKQAELLLETACEKFPANPNPWIALADMSLELFGLDKSDSILRKIQDIFPDIPYPYIKQAHYKAANGEFLEAEEINKKARERFADKINVYIQYAELSEAQDKWSEALERWNIVRDLFPQHTSGFRKAADIAEKIGNADLARRLRLSEKLRSENVSDTSSTPNSIHESHINMTRSRNLWSIAELIWTKSRLNLKSEANQNYLRHVWWILDPLLYMAVFYAVFGLLLQRGGEGYLAYLLTGLVPFQWFAKTTQLASGSILGGRGLMNQVNIPPLFFPLVMITQTAGKQMMIFGMLIIFLLFYGIEPNIHWLGLVPLLFVQLSLVVMVACLVAMLIPFVRDLSNLVPTGIQLIMFVSGIFYSVEDLSEQSLFYFYLNPMATLINEYREILLQGNWPSWNSVGWVLLFSLFGLLGIGIVYRKVAALYPRIVIQ